MPKKKGFGTQLLMGDGAATEAFTAVANLHSIGPLSFEKKVADVTDFDSPNGDEEHVETGVKSYGEIPFEGHWDPTGATHDDSTGLWSKFTEEGPHNFKLGLPQWSLETPAFAGSIVGLEIGAFDKENGVPIRGRLKVSGTLAPPA